jgi:hypothetical protein
MRIRKVRKSDENKFLLNQRFICSAKTASSLLYCAINKHLLYVSSEATTSTWLNSQCSEERT